MQNIGSRRENLERETSDDIPQASAADHPILGQYLKFVNLENSINLLLKHAAEQYKLYLAVGGITEHRAQ
jgi:hypothetical protein